MSPAILLWAPSHASGVDDVTNLDTVLIRRCVLWVLPQPHGEAVVLFDQVWLGAVVVAHGSDDSVAHAHAEMLHITIIAQHVLHEFVFGSRFFSMR